MSKTTYDAIVIGAGFGGSSCAALLAQKGVNVLLVDKNTHAGGKAMSVSKNGFTYTTWLVNSAPRQGSVIAQTLKELGVESRAELVAANQMVTYFKNSKGKWSIGPAASASDMDPNALFDWLEVPDNQKNDALQFFAELTMMPPEQIATLTHVSFGEWMNRYKITQNLKSFLAFLTDGCFLVPIERLCAEEAIQTMQDVLLRSGGMFCKGGWGKASEAFVEAVRQNRGTVLMGARVEKIIIKDGKATGIKTANGDFTAPVIISSAGIQPTVLKLAEKEHFEKGYMDYVRKLEPSWGFMGTRYFLKKKMVGEEFGIIFTPETTWTDARMNQARAGKIPDEVPVWYEVPSIYDPKSTPAGKQLLMTGCVGPADPEMSEKEAKMWLDKAEEMLFQVFPNMPGYIESRDHYLPRDASRLTRDHVLTNQGGECIGLAQAVGQAGALKPAATSPVKGLYFVGCDAGGSGVGIHQAVDSGRKVSKMLLENCFNKG